MKQNSLSPKVQEAYTRDVGRGVARIDYNSMDILNASTGGVIEIKDKRRTVAKCLPLYPSDEVQEILEYRWWYSGCKMPSAVSIR